MHDPAAHHTPTHAQLEAWDASRRQDITNQIARLEQDRATATSTATAATTTAATIQQKRAEREARRRQLAETAAGAEADTEEGTGAIGGGSKVLRHGDAPVPAAATTSNAIHTISVPTTSNTLAWYDSNNNDNDGDDNPERHTYTYETLDAARAAHVWSYPSNAEERARCEVFRDLWEKGYYMGGGSKFGGDWLVYPGACALLLPPLVSFSPFLLTRVCVYMHARPDHR